MACNTCIQNNDCGCNNPCPPEPCACKVYLKSDCINNVTEDLECSGIEKGQTLTEVLVQLDAFICEKFNQTVAYFTLLNVGTGAEVYKGVNGVGNKLIRKINKVGNLITVTQNTDDISISIDETALGTFIEANQKTTVGIQLEPSNTDNKNVYKNTTVVGDVSTLNFRSIVSTDGSVVLTETASTIDITLPIIEDLSIPNFIVNSAYTGTEELGTISKPFKDLPQALTAFVGTGSNINPEFPNAVITIQKGMGYTFTGNLNYNKLTIVWEEGVDFTSNPSTGDFLLDYDTIVSTQELSITLTIKEGTSIKLLKSGFRNAGTSDATNSFANLKQIGIQGNGTISQVSGNIISNDYTIIESNYTTTNTFNNDGATQIIIDSVNLTTNTQSVYKIGGNSRLNIRNSNITINGAIGLPATTEIFNHVGGIVRVNNSNFTITPFFGTILNKVFPISKSASIPANLSLSNITLSGGMVTIFENVSSLQSRLVVNNLTTIDFQCSNIIKSPSVFWTNCFLNNNVIISGVVDTVQVDLTAGNTFSCVNSFSGNVVENLRVFLNKNSAVVAGVPAYSAFIKRNVFNAVDLLAGVEYKVVTSGSPSLGAVGSFITATGIETGTGTASLETREILT